jgi:hypothetical protein
MSGVKLLDQTWELTCQGAGLHGSTRVDPEKLKNSKF